MASRMKEDERNEKIIRGLLKLPANRRCINCNSLGPQYVCINFWTFVCTNCSGIHREFTHRVKSVSMAKFTSQEVVALQGGGNERAKEIYFKEWDPQRHSFPDSSNVDKLRDFIKHVYVDRRFSGERTIDKTPRVKTVGMEDSYENRRADTYQGGSRSPPYEDTYEQRYSERSSPGGNYDARNYRYNYDEKRSPGYDQESRRYGEYRSPVRFEVVDDRRRDDRFGNGRRFEDRKFPDGETKEGRSPSQKAYDMSSPPMVRPVRDILGENVPPLRVGEPPKSNGGKAADGPTHTQRTASSSSLGSIDGNPAELKHTTSATSGSLIDFNIDPEPAVGVAPLSQPTTPPTGQSSVQPTSSSTDENNWASFDFSTPEKVSQVPSNVNTLESVLSQLSAPAARPVDNIAVLPVTGSLPSTVLVTNTSMLPNSGGAPAAPGGHITIPTYGAPPTAPAGNKLPLPLSAGAPAPGPGGVMSTFHLWSTPSSNAPGPFGASTVHPTQAVIKPTQDNSGVALQAPSAESKPIGRKELPADLFTATYLSVPAPVTGWQTGPPRGMGFGMQYPIASHMQTYSHSSKSTNPFDLNNEPTVVQPPMFPSMVSLQGALPNIAAPAGLLRTSSLGNPSPQWVPSPSPSYGSAMPQSPTYATTMPSSPYMGQQVYSPFGHQGVGSSNGASFGNLSTDQQLAGRYSQSPTPSSFSFPGGNPFG